MRSGLVAFGLSIQAGGLDLRIWIDANHPAIHIEADCDIPFVMRAALEMWRTESRPIKSQTGDIRIMQFESRGQRLEVRGQ